MELVLASTSPRRREILARAGYTFRQIDPGDDGPAEATDPATRVVQHARHKAAAGAGLEPRAVVLAADTLVWCAGRFLPKPRDRHAAATMLELLQGREHEVWTGVAVQGPSGDRWDGAAGSRVAFASIPREELAAYLAGQEWCDKAGAYAIQGWAGRWCRLVEGDLDTVIGLPLRLSRELLGRAGLVPPA